MPLHLIRSVTTTHTEYGHFAKTEVWVFGDGQGYSDLIADLDRARRGREPVHITAIPKRSRGMLGVILPAANFPTRKSALRIVERTVFVRNVPAMQVVLCGNRRGYARLAGLAREAIQCEGDPFDHWHCDDDYVEWIVRPSIALNLRVAVKGWSRKQLDCYGDSITSGGTRRLPEDFTYLRGAAEFEYDYIPPDMVEVLTRTA